MKRLLIATSMLVVLVGCTSLNHSASKIGIATAAQKERCSSLGIISTQARLGPNKPASAMNKALNETAKRGGNAVYVVTDGQDWIEGAAVTVEALRCE